MRAERSGPRTSRKTAALRPQYDRELRELWLGGKLVKRFRQRAPEQHLILCAFQEQHWHKRIDDPLPPHGASGNRKLRLNRVIYRLNGHQRNRLINFRGDGSGEGVIWEFWPPQPRRF